MKDKIIDLLQCTLGFGKHYDEIDKALDKILGPTLKINCPICKGRGRYVAYNEDTPPITECRTCQNTGQVWNYLTPEQWEEQTGTKILDSDPVWLTNLKYWPYELYPYRHAVKGDTLVVARLGQPAPPAEWRPK